MHGWLLDQCPINHSWLSAWYPPRPLHHPQVLGGQRQTQPEFRVRTLLSSPRDQLKPKTNGKQNHWQTSVFRLSLFSWFRTPLRKPPPYFIFFSFFYPVAHLSNSSSNELTRNFSFSFLILSGSFPYLFRKGGDSSSRSGDAKRNWISAGFLFLI